jgi:homocysteine S-methyltransferase
MAPNKISTHLSTTSSPLILDGALATYLETLGADISGALWSASILLDQPSLIRQTHLDYFRAGANIAITASYQASIPGLIKHLSTSEADAAAIIQDSVKLAQEARDEYVAEQVKAASLDADSGDALRKSLYVAGSVGPYGTLLADGSEYRGDYSLPQDEMKTFHRGRIQALVDAGVDVLACETMPSKAEIIALLELLGTEFADQEAWFTFTLRDASHISDGTPLSDIAALFTGNEQIVGLGFNCVSDDVVSEALGNLKPLVEKGALIVYPNSGEMWNAKARVIGGCCRTTPGDIRTMKEALEGYEG